MSKYLDLSLIDINKLLKEKTIKPIDLVNEAFLRIEANSDLNSFITLNKEEAIKRAEELEHQEVDNIFFGIPIAIKDSIVTKDLRTTCASKMLENFIPIYDATVIEKLKNSNMIIIGKTNMDEFCMGSTSCTSYFGAPLNPWNKSKVTGGSSGGSANAVAAGLVPFALGSDTGGSIRQPASFCGVVGMKPTYGRVSRYGLVAYGSSLDQIGTITRSVYDNAALLNVISGYDEKDLTSSTKEVDDYTRLIGEDIKGMKIAVPKFFMTDIVDKEVLDNINRIITLLIEKGAIVDFVDIDYIDQAVTIYQIITMAEASSNLARYDGIRYGYSYPNPSSVDELYCKTRQIGFGPQVKKRIMVGSYILSGKNAKIYYDKALQIRNALRDSFLSLFKEYDLVVGPVATGVAYDIISGVDDPLKTFYDDILVMPANMAGLPGMSMPIGFNSEELPIGFQIIGAPFEEAVMYKLASFIEKEVNIDFSLKEVK